MKKVMVCLCFAVVLNFCLSRVAYADELSDLKEQLNLMQRQMQEQTSQIQKMQQKIEKLEAEKATRIKSPEEVVDRIAAIEEKLNKPYEGGLLSLKGAKWEIGGDLELEFVDTQGDEGISEKKPHFQIDKFNLSPKFCLTDDVTLRATAEFTQSGTELTAATLTFSELPLNSEFKIGLDTRFIAPSRLTERHPLAGNAFWRDEEIGLTWSTNFKPFYGLLTWSQGLKLDTKQVGEDSSFKMIHDSTLISNYGGVKEVGVGLGFANPIGSSGNIDLLGFGYFNELSSADIAFLKSNLSGYTSDSDTQYRAGANLNYVLKNFNFFGQFINAKDGSLDRYAWYVQPSYKVKLPFNWKYCKEHELLFRYGKYDIDTTKAFAKPATWDREELTFAVITDVLKNVKVKTEYTINNEKTGNGYVDDNEFEILLKVVF